MNVKELKELIKDVPDNYEVRYEYDGPETLSEILARVIIVSDKARCILLCETEN